MIIISKDEEKKPHPIVHLLWKISLKIIDGYKTLTIFANKLCHRYFRRKLISLQHISFHLFNVDMSYFNK